MIAVVVSIDRNPYTSGNRRSGDTIRRPFGCGIVGRVAESGELSNVNDAYSHPNFDRTAGFSYESSRVSLVDPRLAARESLLVFFSNLLNIIED